jgi:hypothetical protein
MDTPALGAELAPFPTLVSAFGPNSALTLEQNHLIIEEPYPETILDSEYYNYEYIGLN